MNFKIPKEAIEYLKKQDDVMHHLIMTNDIPKRVVYNDIKLALIDIIIGQQISNAVHKVLLDRFKNAFTFELGTLKQYCQEDFHAIGLSKRKAETIEVVIHHPLNDITDETLLSIKGIGPWTVEMVHIFYHQTLDCLALHDGGIKAAINQLYPSEQSDLYETLKKRFSPYGTIASFYLWESLVN